MFNRRKNSPFMLNSTKETELTKICPKCSYDLHDGVKDTNCRICGTSLSLSRKMVRHSKGKNNSLHKYFPTIAQGRVSQWQNLLDNSGIPKAIKSLEWDISFKELKKPFNLLALALIGLAIVLWVNYFIEVRKTVSITSELKASQQQLHETPPKGLYSYGGEPIFAPLVASGLNGAIESKYPGFELRYTKPLNHDYSSNQGIEMLLNGELSFAYIGRPLTESEYREAKLRGIKLIQIPIAIDGLTVFGNNSSRVNDLNVEQVRQLFRGDLTNWKDIDSSLSSLPIVPVAVENENLQLLGIDKGNHLNSNIEYVPNYTQALRKVINTPGAVSYASASLVQNQKLIKIFNLADGNSDYVSPIIGDNLNLPDFKSGKYPLTRRIFVVYREDTTPDRLAAEAYVNFVTSDEGQFIVDKSGFVRLY